MNISSALYIVFFLVGLFPNPEPEIIDQYVVVIVPHEDSNQGHLYKFERVDGKWVQIGPKNPVTIGRNGTAWAPSPYTPSNVILKKEGDKRSPAGIFPLKQSFGRRSEQKARYVQMPYTQISPYSQCIEDSSSTYYNQIVFDNTKVAKDWLQDDRMLREDDLYDWGLFVDYNQEKVPGKGSCIFMHGWRGSDKATAGCTAMSQKHLEQVVYWLNPEKNPHLALFPRNDYEKLRNELDLPEIK